VTASVAQAPEAVEKIAAPVLDGPHRAPSPTTRRLAVEGDQAPGLARSGCHTGGLPTTFVRSPAPRAGLAAHRLADRHHEMFNRGYDERSVLWAEWLSTRVRAPVDHLQCVCMVPRRLTESVGTIGDPSRIHQARDVDPSHRLWWLASVAVAHGSA
jgi:hypothetical protein